MLLYILQYAAFIFQSFLMLWRITGPETCVSKIDYVFSQLVVIMMLFVVKCCPKYFYGEILSSCVMCVKCVCNKSRHTNCHLSWKAIVSISDARYWIFCRYPICRYFQLSVADCRCRYMHIFFPAGWGDYSAASICTSTSMIRKDNIWRKNLGRLEFRSSALKL